MNQIEHDVLYELTEKDWDLFGSGRHVDEVRERLKALNIYQYFYPPADSVALGLIDRDVGTEAEIQRGSTLQRRVATFSLRTSCCPKRKTFPNC